MQQQNSKYGAPTESTYGTDMGSPAMDSTSSIRVADTPPFSQTQPLPTLSSRTGAQRKTGEQAPPFVHIS